MANWQRTVLRMMGAREQSVTVTAVHDVLPWYRRITFSAPEFVRALEPFPTVWIRLWVPSIDDPTIMKQRGYTLVDPDPEAGTFALDFVLHGPDPRSTAGQGSWGQGEAGQSTTGQSTAASGPAAVWAQETRIDDTAEIAFTPARITPDRSIARFILVGDATAIPAFNSLLDYVPQSACVDVILRDDHDDAASLLRPHPGAHVTRVTSADHAAHTLRGLEPDLADVYVWAAGERRTISAVRDVVRKQWKLPKDRQHTQYYWIEGRASS